MDESERKEKTTRILLGLDPVPDHIRNRLNNTPLAKAYRSEHKEPDPNRARLSNVAKHRLKILIREFLEQGLRNYEIATQLETNPIICDTRGVMLSNSALNLMINLIRLETGRLTRGRGELMYKLHLNGMSDKAIAAKFGVSAKSAHKMIYRHKGKVEK